MEPGEIASALGITQDESNISVLQTLSRSIGGKNPGSVLDVVPAEVAQALRNSENIFGRYIIVEKIGEGGMGSVFRAYDTELSRYVALKFIKSQRAEELKAEAKTLASLEHRNIARIYDIGTAHGKGYIAIQLVNGNTLTAANVPSPLPVMMAVCAAVDYAHKRGVIHRDIKPDNIMLDADENVFVMDFGLALSEVEGLASNRPQSTEVVGTPGYMAPEIASGKGQSTQTDVYSLGATLYQLLSGSCPMPISSEMNLESVLEKIRRGEYVPIRKIVTEIPPELEAIVNKSLAQDPEKRYSTAQALADDIRSYMAGYPVSAYGGGPFYSIRKAISRNKKFAAAGIIAAAALAAAIYFSAEKSRVVVEESKQKEELKRKLIEKLRKEFSEKLDYALKFRRAGMVEEVRKLGSSLDACHTELEAAGGLTAESEYMMARYFRAVVNYEKAKQFVEKSLQLNASYAPALYEQTIHASKEYSELYRTARMRLAGDSNAGFHRERDGITAKMVEESEPGLRRIRSTMESAAARIQRDTGLTPAQILCMNGLPDAYVGISQSDAQKQLRARELLEGALKSDATLEESYLGLHELAFTKGDLASAIEWLTKGLAIDKGYEPFYIARAYAHVYLGQAKWNLGQNAEEDMTLALSDAEQATKLFPGSAESHYTLGGTAMNLGVYRMEIGAAGLNAYSESEAALTEAIRLKKDYYDAYCRRANVRGNIMLARSSGNIDAAAVFKAADDDYAHAIAINKGLPEAWGSRAILRTNYADFLCASGSSPLEMFRLAEEDFRVALQIRKDDDFFWMGKAILEMTHANLLMDRGGDAMKFYEEANEDASHALQLVPNSSAYYIYRGNVRYNFGSYLDSCGKNPMKCLNEAEADFLRAQKMGIGYKAWLGIAEVRGAMADYQIRTDSFSSESLEKSEFAASKAIELMPKEYKPWLDRGITRLRRAMSTPSDFADAESDVTEAIRLNKDSADAHGRMGELCSIRGKYLAESGKDPQKDYDRALLEFGIAAGLSPRGGYLRQRANLRLQMADFIDASGGDPTETCERAEEDYLKHLEKNQPNCGILSEIGNVHLKKGNYLHKIRADASPEYVKAAELLERAVKLDSSDSEAWMLLALSHSNLALCHQRAGTLPDDEYSLASRFISKSIEIDERKQIAWYWKGVMEKNRAKYLQSTGQESLETFKQADASFTRSIGLNGSHVPSLTKRAWCRLEIGMKLNSIEILQSAVGDCKYTLKIRPDCADAWIVMGKAELARVQRSSLPDNEFVSTYEQAIGYYTNALQAEPENLDALLDRGGAKMNLAVFRYDRGTDPFEQYVSAEKDFTNAAGVSPENFLCFEGRGTVRRNIAIYLFYSKKDPTDWCKKSEEDYTKLVALASTRASGYFGRGNTRLILAMHLNSRKMDARKAAEDTIADLETARKLDPSLDAQTKPLIDEARKILDSRDF